MIRLPADMSRDDVNQWLAGGIFLVHTRGKTDLTPCAWVGLTGNPNEVKVRCQTLDTNQTKEVVPHSCYAVWPELGSFNMAETYAVHLSRFAVKQYRRTFNDRCVRISVPWSYYVNPQLNRSIRNVPHWHQVATLPWLGKFPANVDEAEDWLRSGRLTVAVNRRMVLAGNTEVDKRLIYMDGRLAGTVMGGVLFPTCDEDTCKTMTDMLGGRYNVATN